MTTKEKIEAIDNLIGMVDDNHGTDYDEALKSAKRSLMAWDKVIEEIEQLRAKFKESGGIYEHSAYGLDYATEIINKHLKEVNDGSKNL